MEAVKCSNCIGKFSVTFPQQTVIRDQELPEICALTIC